MLKKILGTAGSRLISAVLSFAIIIVMARELGPTGTGTVSLILLGITINLLLVQVVSGGAIIYLVPRFPVKQLLGPVYLWAFLAAGIGTLLLQALGRIPEGYMGHVWCLTVLQGLSSCNMNILVGRERIKAFNSLMVGQVVVQFLTFAGFVFVFRYIQVMAYVYALYFAFGLTYLYGLILIRKELRQKGSYFSLSVLKEIVQHGSYVQLANGFQLLNYRLPYYIIEAYFGKARVGVYSVGNQLSEGLWLVGKSVATVQYGRIANEKDVEKNKQLTLYFLKFTTLATLFMLGVMLLLPVDFFVFVFRKDFSGVRPVIQALGVGIVAISMNMIFSHFFSGTGRHFHNSISSGIGLLITVGLGFYLIPRYGIIGAAYTASVSYSVSMVYQAIVFCRLTRVRAREFMVNRNDLATIGNELRLLFKR